MDQEAHGNRLLNELDEDLMIELDITVRQNQLARLPIAKSGRAEAELLDSYPQLAEIIERGKRAKVDQIAFQSRWRHEDVLARSSISRSGHVIEDDDKTQFPVRQRQSRTSSDHQSPLQKSPNLLAKTSKSDLMFDMDDHEEEHSRDPAQQTSNERLCNRLETGRQSQTPNPTAKSPWLHTGDSNSYIGSASSPSPGILGLDGSQQLSVHGSDSPTGSGKSQASIPWGSRAIHSQKLDMKTIMTQASSNQVSSISTGLSSLTPSSSHSTRLSQRERKRQQQQAALQQPLDLPTPEIVEPQADTLNASSPWQVASSGGKMSLKEILSAENTSPSPSRSKSDRTPSNPQLTMRQTVPGNAPTTKRTTSEGSSIAHPTPSQRSTSTPNTSQAMNTAPRHSSSRAMASASPITIGPSNTVTPKSIRHASYPASAAEPSFQLSMADILSQQQTEKDVFKEAVAKRSLQEIQEEQAFQEWWDQESRKVMEEEQQASAAAAAMATGRKHERRSRGRERGRGRGEDRPRGRGKLGRSEKVGDAKGEEASIGKGSRGGGSGRGRGRGTETIS
ncbi:MAG: hypothetical protein Q9209_006297 [Squamulea sp. 1 TL-2023]